MTSRETKIPLLLTLIALGFLVHWAIGFVQQHRKPQVAAQPEMQLATQEAPLLSGAPITTVGDSAPAAEAAASVAAKKQPLSESEKDAIMPHATGGPSVGRPVNRKLKDILEASGHRG